VENKQMKIVVLFIIGSFLLACKPRTLSPQEFLVYCNSAENGLINEREVNNIAYSVKYEPIEYKVINELNIDKTEISLFNYNKLKTTYDSLYYFVFKIKNVSSSKSPIKLLAKNPEDLGKIMHYCNSDFSKQFYLESNDNKIEPVIFHYEDDYNLTNFNLISVAFEANKIDTDKDVVFVYDDPFFNNGLLKFEISKKSIKNIPKVNIN
jgi:hypothetical protein